jgi:hypothetical protein
VPSGTTTTTVPENCKPGYGHGDKNHCHTGPPGHDHGDHDDHDYNGHDRWCGRHDNGGNSTSWFGHNVSFTEPVPASKSAAGVFGIGIAVSAAAYGLVRRRRKE